MLTVINPNHLLTIIKLSGDSIRDFLSHADAVKFKGEAHNAILSFQSNPHDFTDEKLVSYGADVFEAIHYPIRIEVRGKSKEGAAQMVAKGIWGPKRAEAVTQILKKCHDLGIRIHLKLAGTSSIEFNVEGVDKALPIRFLQGAFIEVLKEMSYQPGLLINSFESRTVIAADGDGTIYDGPKVGVLPSLADSPVREPLLAYLKAGGVFMLVSGNDIQRTFKRLVESLPPEVHCRVLIAANGGAELVYVNAHGHSAAISSYRSQAFEIAKDHAYTKPLDIVYIGDDGSRDGNDYPAFKAVGFERSVLVAPEFLKDFDPALKSAFVGELLKGTQKYLEKFLLLRAK